MSHTKLTGSAEPPLVHTVTSTPTTTTALTYRPSTLLRDPRSSSRQVMSMIHQQRSLLTTPSQSIPSVLLFPPTSISTSLTTPNVSLSSANKQHDWQSMQQHKIDMSENVVLDNDSRGIKVEHTLPAPRLTLPLCTAQNQSMYGKSEKKQHDTTYHLRHSTISHRNIGMNGFKLSPVALSRRAFARVAVQRL